MIVNQKKNASFRSTLLYVLGKEKSTIIDTNMGGETPRQLAAELAAARRHRPNLKRACGHIIISIPHRRADHSHGEYHEHLEDEQYAAIAHRWLKGMEFLGEGLSCSQYLIARHHDTLHEHIHIIASRIRMDGSVVSDSWDYRRSEVIVRQLEKEFGLEATPCSNERVAQKVEEKGISTTVADRRALSRKQKHHSSCKPPIKQQLAALIDEATASHPTVTELIGRLQRNGVIIHPQFSTKGLFKEAIAFELDGVKVAGNKIGSAYSFPGLLRKRGVSYLAQRDNPALFAALSGEVVQLHETFSELLPELLPELPHQPPQHKVKESLPIEVSTANSSPNHLTHEVDETEPSDKSELISPVVEHTSYALQQIADENYLTLWLVFQRAKGLRNTKEIDPGSWVYEDKEYAFAYNSSKDLFSVGHIERGILFRYQSRKLLEVGQISKEDIEAFAKYELRRSPPNQLKPPSSPQRGKSLELS
ncbi:MAG TPA: relaxase/mobilization nuclease domain-containing protein [Leptolyngbyaceae cyanobacterium]